MMPRNTGCSHCGLPYAAPAGAQCTCGAAAAAGNSAYPLFSSSAWSSSSSSLAPGNPKEDDTATAQRIWPGAAPPPVPAERTNVSQDGDTATAQRIWPGAAPPPVPAETAKMPAPKSPPPERRAPRQKETAELPADKREAKTLVDKFGGLQERDDEGDMVLHYACRHAFTVGVVRCLVKRGADIHAKGKDGATPLHAAADNGVYNQAEIAEYLVEQGADVNARDSYGYTPLHKACMFDREMMVRLLVEHGADVNAKNKDLRTPLHVICRMAHYVACGEAIARILVERGADITARSVDGSIPIVEAKPDAPLQFLHDLVAAQVAAEAAKRKLLRVSSVPKTPAVEAAPEKQPLLAILVPTPPDRNSARGNSTADVGQSTNEGCLSWLRRCFCPEPPTRQRYAPSGGKSGFPGYSGLPPTV